MVAGLRAGSQATQRESLAKLGLGVTVGAAGGFLSRVPPPPHRPLPRSPSDGAHTRSASEIDFPPISPIGRTGRGAGAIDGVRDVGPPRGTVDRRQRDRRVADRRRGAERRQGVRRLDGNTRAAGLGMRSSLRREPLPLPRVASREYGPLNERTARAPKILRALLIAAVAIASLMAATLEEAKSATIAAAAGKAGVVTKTADGVTATVAYVRQGRPSTGANYSQLRLTVRAPGAPRCAASR